MQALQQQTHTRTTRKTRWPLQTLLIATALQMPCRSFEILDTTVEGAG